MQIRGNHKPLKTYHVYGTLAYGLRMVKPLASLSLQSDHTPSNFVSYIRIPAGQLYYNNYWRLDIKALTDKESCFDLWFV